MSDILRELAERQATLYAAAVEDALAEALLPLVGADHEEFERLCARARETREGEDAQALAALLKRHDIFCAGTIGRDTQTGQVVTRFIVRQHGVVVAALAPQISEK